METKPYPGIKSAIFLCLIFLGINLSAGIILDYAAYIFGLYSDSTGYGTGLIITYLLAFGIVIFIGFKKTKKKFNDIFMFNKISWQLWPAIIIFMCGLIILLADIDNLLNYFLPMPDFFSDAFAAVLSNESMAVSIIYVVLLPGFMEEMMFRGIILNGFKENYPVKKAILLSALFFGVIHLNPWQFVTAFIIGIISAWICIKTKSLLPSIYMHLFNNGFFVFATKNKDDSFFKWFFPDQTEQTFLPLWLDAAGVLLAGIGAVMLVIELRKQERENY
jgi:membrane protease YdiL (CAAX protease family)